MTDGSRKGFWSIRRKSYLLWTGMRFGRIIQRMDKCFVDWMKNFKYDWTDGGSFVCLT